MLSLDFYAWRVDGYKSFMLKYVKSGNYNTIKQPAVAGKLLRDFNKTFLKIEDKE